MARKSRLTAIRTKLPTQFGSFFVEDDGIYKSLHGEFPTERLREVLRALLPRPADSMMTPLERLSSLRDKLRSSNDQAAQLLDRLLSRHCSQRQAEIILQAICIGRLLERMEVLPLQHYALAGKRQAHRNAKTARDRAVTEKEKQRRFQAVQKELQNQALRGDRINKELAYRTVAEQTGVRPGIIKKNYLWLCRKPVF
jgi:hypothetical protein